MSLAFEVKNLAKHYGNVKALDGVTLEAKEGSIFGLLGPNGAGKTTLVRALSTLLEPDKGSAKVLGIDVIKNPQRVREVIGLAGQFAAVDEYLTGEENLYMVGRLYHLSAKETKQRTKELLERLNLADAAKRQVRTYSGGMRRRLDLGACLVGRPKILFLDEPTTGLDPRTRLDLWEIIRDLVSQGTSILLTTQYLEEADVLADKIAVIDRGKVIAEGTSAKLKAMLGGDVIEIQLESERDRQKAEQAIKGIAKKASSYDEATKTLTIPVGSDGSKSLAEVVRSLDRAKVPIHALALHQPSLDDVFLTLTGAKASEVATDAKPKRKRAA
ncbi:MAG: putative multidrug transporter ATP-binding protein [Candidatus Saccharibacteria bacterium]|nr:putative multidrug transporter ATP-binding protein [Candidatus Saccharibacteria bacterium]